MPDFHLQPVSWLSLGLLFMTGAGLIYYYDNEKKRLIDGKLIVLVYDKSLIIYKMNHFACHNEACGIPMYGTLD